MRPPRISFAGGVYHVTIRCNNRQFGFKGDDDFALYIQVLLEAKAKYEVKIYAYCLTHNHVHLLVATLEKDNLSKFMGHLSGNFATPLRQFLTWTFERTLPKIGERSSA